MKKYFSAKSLVFIFFFSLFFIAPHFIQYFNQGIFISGDYFYNEGNFIKNLSSLKFYIQENYLKSLYFIKNPIFIFFIVGAIFQKIIKEI
tara:strand:- start:128 stop:397 length:270 start_codon:yes stop_codon:yes gene_type:complete